MAKYLIRLVADAVVSVEADSDEEAELKIFEPDFPFPFPEWEIVSTDEDREEVE
jgi:hypothetical protein